MKRTVVMNDLSPEFRQSCQIWYEALPTDKRTAVDSWLAGCLLPECAPASDRVPYAYCEAPAEIDAWVVCRIAAADITPEWIAKRTPLIEVLPSGDMQSPFRASELREVASA